MILTPPPLQRPTLGAGAPRLPRAGMPVRALAPARPVLQTLRAPQQLCLDLQPRPR